MARYRNALPQLTGDAPLLTDGGLETTLTFADGIELPHYAACELLRSEHGWRVLLDYLDEYAAIARDAALPFSASSPTWRASPDWTARLGYSHEEFVEVNREGVRLAQEVRRRFETPTTPVVIAGIVGPRWDSLELRPQQSETAAAEYHFAQIEVFALTAADYVCALTLIDSVEATGITRAAEAAGIPVVLSFQLEDTGLLASGESLERAIDAVDAATDGYPAYYMVDCTSPAQLPGDLAFGAASYPAAWTKRIRGFRAHVGRYGDRQPAQLAREVLALRESMPQLVMLGACCAVDSAPTRAIAEGCAAQLRC